jgi:hypothetical protein
MISTTMEELNKNIQIKQTEVNLEKKPIRKQELQKQLMKLKLRAEIEAIKRRIDQLG